MMVYSLRRLRKAYGDRTVLDIDAVDIERGRIHALLGPNGSGKTTLMNVLAFLDPPTEGTLHFDGRPVTFNESALQRLRRQVVLVDQHPILFSTSVYKNLAFGLKIRGVPELERRRLIDAALEMVDMQAFRQAAAHKLSGGETQRVALARALVLSPKVMLCDEPTASVDADNQARIGRLLTDINREKGITIIFTSHDRLQAASLPHHRLYLDQGKVRRHAGENTFTVDQVQRNPVFRQQLPGGTVSKLEAETTGRTPARFQIDPWQVTLSAAGRDDTAGLLAARIVGIREVPEGIRLVVNSGEPLVVMLTVDRYRKLQPMIGEMRAISIPPAAIIPLD
jgi:tungstate transport system ATP-binding protein